MNVLSIGNSFSQDAQRYLHGIARSAGVKLECFNLYIGGCSLSRHYRNMLSGEGAYTLEMNGSSTGFCVSIKEALLSRDWDIITVQQVSGQSVDYGTYQPYLGKIVEYIRECAPKAKLAIHQTWAYEEDSYRLTVEHEYAHHKDMLADIISSYNSAYTDVSADILIPSGEVMGELFSAGIEKIHRDTFHAAYGIGRYAIGLIWYATLTGKDVQNVSFTDFDEPVSAVEIETAKECVRRIYEKYHK